MKACSSASSSSSSLAPFFPPNDQLASSSCNEYKSLLGPPVDRYRSLGRRSGSSFSLASSSPSNRALSPAADSQHSRSPPSHQRPRGLLLGSISRSGPGVNAIAGRSELSERHCTPQRNLSGHLYVGNRANADHFTNCAASPNSLVSSHLSSSERMTDLSQVREETEWEQCSSHQDKVRFVRMRNTNERNRLAAVHSSLDKQLERELHRLSLKKAEFLDVLEQLRQHRPNRPGQRLSGHQRTLARSQTRLRDIHSDTRAKTVSDLAIGSSNSSSLEAGREYNDCLGLETVRSWLQVTRSNDPRVRSGNTSCRNSTRVDKLPGQEVAAAIKQTINRVNKANSATNSTSDLLGEEKRKVPDQFVQARHSQLGSK
ncbi:unnamed protein product [Protopolystoma xenopodis]|uniref:Uncharacterized protein n=1 Tax=Protopolystoma xenopodis TaxID=117903 RepID=A0A3S5CT17_9PLAT|nr:unnamed protein product [Protopolystoma xenopodis]